MRDFLVAATLTLARAACSDGAGPLLQGIDPDLLDEGIARIQRGEYGEVHSLLVYRRDELVLEEYFHGTGSGTRSSIESVTKSITSTLVGPSRAPVRSKTTSNSGRC